MRKVVCTAFYYKFRRIKCIESISFVLVPPLVSNRNSTHNQLQQLQLQIQPPAEQINVVGDD